MTEKYFERMKFHRFLSGLFLPAALLLSSASHCQTAAVDSIALRLDRAFLLLNGGKNDSAVATVQKIEIANLSNVFATRIAKLTLAGLHSQPGYHAWFDLAGKLPSGVWSPQEKIWILEQALNAGYLPPVNRLFADFSPDKSNLIHRWEILQARLDGFQGHWNEAGLRLAHWKANPVRREGSGEVLFWQGWVAFNLGQRADADTLFLLSSAYADEGASEKALEYRFALQLDSGENLKAYLRGLPESPLASSARLISLQRVATSSPLHPFALWAMAMVCSQSGKKLEELSILEQLSRDLSTTPARQALIRLVRSRYEQGRPDSAMASYEHLLLQYQQGVPSEFAKSRVQVLRKDGVKNP